MQPDPALRPEALPEDLDRALRPQVLDDFVGQAEARANLRVFIQSARMRGESMDHTLFHGPPGLGKTTLAQTLEREQSALRLTTDEWHVHLFGQDAEEPEHDARHSLIEAMLWNIASRALELGTNVILDFGFWAREEREDYRSRAKQLGASSEVHFLDVAADELMHRLAVRNSQPSQTSFYIPEAMMKPWIVFFQRPTPDELERYE